MATYRKAEAVVDKYNRDLAEWESQVKEKSRPSVPPQKRVLETGSDSCRSKADSRRYERNPLAETADR